MPAVSKKQQRFFGIVRAIQKGEMAPTTPETAKAAADMKKSDVKDFASTKHKKLPEKKVAKEAADFSQRDKIMKRAKPLHKHLYKNLHKGDRTGDVNEGWSDKYKKSIDCNNPKGFSQRAHCQGRKKKVSEEKKPLPKQKMDDKIKKVASSSASELAAGNRKNFSKNSERLTKMMKARFEETKYDKYDKEKKQFAKADNRMKFGKFYDKAKEARDRLRPGEVKKWDPVKKKYVSNKN